LTIYILFEPISVNWGHEAGLAGADGNIVFQKMFLSPDPPFLNTFTLHLAPKATSFKKAIAWIK
jgi:hypothetical protein